MPKSVSTGYATYRLRALTRYALCCKIVRLDSVVLAVTNHDRALTISGVRYEPFGLNLSDFRSASSGDVGNVEATGILRSDSITEDALRAGRWDAAYGEIFRVVWDDLALGREVLWAGWLGETTVDLLTFKAELLGMLMKTANSVVELTSASCRANLGDARCKVDLTPLTVSGVVEAMESDYYTLILDAGRTEPDVYFDGGVITFGAGPGSPPASLLTGLRREVKGYVLDGGDGPTIVLQTDVPYDATGYAYTMTPGCDKSRRTCIDRFDNILNRRAEDWTQGNDKLVQPARHEE